MKPLVLEVVPVQLKDITAEILILLDSAFDVFPHSCNRFLAPDFIEHVVAILFHSAVVSFKPEPVEKEVGFPYQLFHFQFIGLRSVFFGTLFLKL